MAISQSLENKWKKGQQSDSILGLIHLRVSYFHGYIPNLDNELRKGWPSRTVCFVGYTNSLFSWLYSESWRISGRKDNN